MKRVTTIAFAAALGISVAASAQDISAAPVDAQPAQDGALNPLDPAGVQPQAPESQPPETQPPESMPHEPMGPPDNTTPPLTTPPPMHHDGAKRQPEHPATGMPTDDTTDSKKATEGWHSKDPGDANEGTAEPQPEPGPA